MFFFFQAEDGIRDGTVTGVQTCALPISRRNRRYAPRSPGSGAPQLGRRRLEPADPSAVWLAVRGRGRELAGLDPVEQAPHDRRDLRYRAAQALGIAGE